MCIADRVSHSDADDLPKTNPKTAAGKTTERNNQSRYLDSTNLHRNNSLPGMRGREITRDSCYQKGAIIHIVQPN